MVQAADFTSFQKMFSSTSVLSPIYHVTVILPAISVQLRDLAVCAVVAECAGQYIRIILMSPRSKPDDNLKEGR